MVHERTCTPVWLHLPFELFRGEKCCHCHEWSDGGGKETRMWPWREWLKIENMVPAIRRKSRKKGGRKSERRGCWQQAYNTVFHQTVMLLCWLFPSSCFYCQCMYQATPNKHNQSQPTRPIPSSFPPFLSGGDYWLDLKDFLFPKTSTESISSPGRRFWLYQGPETPNPPSCCWETTPVICVLSECITDGDVRARERERDAEMREEP